MCAHEENLLSLYGVITERKKKATTTKTKKKTDIIALGVRVQENSEKL